MRRRPQPWARWELRRGRLLDVVGVVGAPPDPFFGVGAFVGRGDGVGARLSCAIVRPLRELRVAQAILGRGRLVVEHGRAGVRLELAFLRPSGACLNGLHVRLVEIGSLAHGRRLLTVSAA